jgi:hypothetical protein
MAVGTVYNAVSYCWGDTNETKRFWSTAILSMLLPTWKKQYVASEYETRDRLSRLAHCVSAKRISRATSPSFLDERYLFEGQVRDIVDG